MRNFLFAIDFLFLYWWKCSSTVLLLKFPLELQFCSFCYVWMVVKLMPQWENSSEYFKFSHFEECNQTNPQTIDLPYNLQLKIKHMHNISSIIFQKSLQIYTKACLPEKKVAPRRPFWIILLINPSRLAKTLERYR